MRWLLLLITVYLLGMLVFYTAATFYADHYSEWDTAYYLWSKSVDVLLGAVIVTRPKRVDLFKPLFILIILRWAWDIICLPTGWSVNSVKAVGVLFVTLIAVCLLIFYKQANEWRRQK